MGSVNPKYSSANYDAAREKYQALADRYAGSAGLKIAQSQGSNIAETAGKSAVQSAIAGARSAGMSKAQSALSGAGSGSKAASDNYATGLNASLSKQQNEIGNALNAMNVAKDIDNAKYQGKVNTATGTLGALGSALGSAAGLIGAGILASDETLKNLYPDMGDEILDAFRKIRSCEFEYTPEAQEMAQTEILPGIDADVHMGVSAQDVEAVLPDAVMDNGDGHKLVDTKEMTMANTAAIAELARKVKELEERI